MSDGRVLLITGASTGIGAATAQLAAERGFRLVLTARNRDKLDALVGEIGEERALAVGCDVASWEDQQRAADAAIERFGAIDAVFANAGRGGVPGGYAEGDPAEWHEMIMTNFYGLALTLRATLGHLKASKGDLLITGSIAGRRPIPGSVYGATKWAAKAVGYNVRGELQGSGVRVTLIEPGMVDTPFFDDPKPDALRAEDVARTVLFVLEQPKSVLLNEVVVVPTAQNW
ncbi:MAG: SDR family oxidoreductase [Hyphomicrobiaceae bacterium]